MGSTKKELIEDLKKTLVEKDLFLTPDQKIGINQIIESAERDGYHDFLSPLATPKVQLHSDLCDLALGELANNVAKGAYDDETPEDK